MAHHSDVVTRVPGHATPCFAADFLCGPCGQGLTGPRCCRKSRSRSRSRGGGGGGGGRSRSRSGGRRSRSRSRDRKKSRSRSRSRGRGGGGSKKRLKGEACRWNPRGFGFIKPADGGEDLFCHVSSIRDGNALRDGDIVEYEESWDDRKGKNMVRFPVACAHDGLRAGPCVRLCLGVATWL